MVHTPFLSLGTDTWTGKPYHLCSKKSLMSFAVILLLIFTMTSERVLFKLMVDRMESYRFFLCQLMTFLYIPPLFCIVGYKSSHDEYAEEEPSEFPKMHFLVMGMLDLLNATMLFIAGGRTDPSQTLFFMQATIPLTACLSMAVFNTRYSRLQLLGILTIAGGVMISLSGALDELGSSDYHVRHSGWNSVFYLLAAIPGSISMIYKERAIRDQPMDMIYLNAWVSVYQFIGGFLLAPIIFNSQSLHLGQKMSGLECLINARSEDPTDKCAYGLWLLFAFILSNVSINFLLMQLIRLTSVAVMNTTTLIGFVSAFAALEWYRMDPNGFGGDITTLTYWLSSPIALDFVAFVVLVIGKMMYQWEPDPEIQATTASADDKEAASLLSDAESFGLRYM